MNEKPKDDIVAVIRKILSRTEQNGCTPAEAEVAFAMAARKMAEHNLTMEDVRVSEHGEESWLEEDVEHVMRWNLEDNLCYGILKEFYFVEAILNPLPDGGKVFRIFGTPENVAIGRFIWSALHASFERCWCMYRYLNKRPASERRLFITGMANGFSSKLRDERAAMIMERDIVKGKGTALALTSIKEKTLAAFKAANPRTKTKRGGFSDPTGDRSTLKAGVEAGRALKLQRALNTNGRKAIG